MKYGFLLTDSNGNDYRTIATSLTAAIEKTASENNLKEDEIISCKRGNSIGSVSL
jgi:hypothetical protein